MNDLSFSDIAARLNDRIEDLARELLGEPNKGLSTREQLRFGSKGTAWDNRPHADTLSKAPRHWPNPIL